MSTSPLAGLPLPDLSSTPNGPSALSALAVALEKQLLLKFTTATARDAAITSPVAGMVVYLSTPKAWTYYNGSAWHALLVPPTAYTPTLGAGIVPGSGGSMENTAWYTYADGQLHVEGEIVLGSSGQSVGSSGHTVTLPSGFTATDVGNTLRPVGKVWFNDLATASYEGPIAINTSTTVRFFTSGTAGAIATVNTPSSSSPMVWGAGDAFAYSLDIMGILVM